MPPRQLGPALLRSALAAAGLFLAAASAPVARAVEIAWEVRILSADLTTTELDRSELLIDVGGDPVDRRVGIQQGTLLAHASGLPVGRSRDEGGATLVAELGESFTVESRSKAFELDVDARADRSTNGRLVAELTLRLGPRLVRTRTVPLSANRARLWVVPGWSEVHAVLIEAWAAGASPQVPRRSETVDVELALVRGQWRAGSGPESLPESDFPTWVDPFELEEGQSAEALLRPVSAGVATAGTLVLQHELQIPTGELMTFERGRRPEGGAGGGDFLGATVLVRGADSVPAGLGSPADLLVNLSLQSSQVGAPSLVQMRRMRVQAGGVHAWLIPTDEHVHAVFLRVTPRQPGLAQPVRPAAESP